MQTKFLGVLMSDVTGRTAGEKPKTGLGWLFKVGTWALTLLCFYLVFNRTEATAARESLTVAEYLLRFFQDADWTAWLMVMIPYSLFFFSVDSHASWRAIRWFNAPLEPSRCCRFAPAPIFCPWSMNRSVRARCPSILPDATTYLDGRHCLPW